MAGLIDYDLKPLSTFKLREIERFAALVVLHYLDKDSKNFNKRYNVQPLDDLIY
jgi:hypothetical protein